ncbi:hypothetical protein FRC12_018372 [Ceratobasidium sp. 428]|nr:hypothetical protein FRC12_018372 [Ceratobasidium sp. 428]
MSIESRMLGAVLGGALGDAIGLFMEFLSRSHSIELYGSNPSFSLQIPPPPGQTGMKQDRHRSMFAPSGWTDDTDQSLLILLSFLASGGTTIDAMDFAKRLKFWVNNGLRCLDRLPLGLGRTVGNVVRDEGFEGNPVGTAVKYWEATNRFVAANGAVMRTAIIGALLFPDRDGVNGIDRAMHAAVQVAATTHPDPRCLASCTIVTALIAATMRNELHTISEFNALVHRAIEFIQSPPSVPSDPSAYTPTPLSDLQKTELLEHVYAVNLEWLKLDNRQEIGYTLKCLGAGTWALRQALETGEDQRAGLFERCITEITMQGGDADTNATVAGSLLGAYLIITHIPQKWIDHLRDVEWLADKTRCAAYFVDPSGGSNMEYNRTEDTYPEYNWREDPDVLVDGGKGAFTEDEIRKRYDELLCEVGRRVNDGIELPGLKGKKTKNKDGCIVC